MALDSSTSPSPIDVRCRRVACLAICWLLPVACVWAQQPPQTGYVYPPGGAAGSTIDVMLGGYDWTPDTEFFVLDKRIKLEILGPPGEMLHPAPPHWFGPKARNKPFSVPREVPARLTIPADMPAGPIGWQAANANGGTSVRQFVVGRGTQVVEEQLASADRRLPPLPLTLSGRLENKEEVDRYTLVASRSGPVTCTFESHDFGFPLNPVLQIRDQQGQLVVDAADTQGQGLSVTFVAQAGQVYSLLLHDLDYRGNRAMIYRLALVEAPRVVAALPAAGNWGEKQQVRFVGYGIASGSARLETVDRDVEFPGDRSVPRFHYELATPWGTAPEFVFELSDTRQTVEARSVDVQAGDAQGRHVPNGEIPNREATDRAAPKPLELPIAVTGVLAEHREQDEYTLQAVKGDIWAVEVDAQRIGSPLDVSLRILDAAGRQVAAADDGNGTTDAATLFKVPGDGEYRVVLRDLSDRSGSLDAVYRLRIERPRAAFELTVPDKLDVPLGGATSLVVKAARRGDFQQAISIQFTDLPAGVTAAPSLEIPAGKDQVSIPLTADATAAAAASRVTLRATAMVEPGRLVEEHGPLVVEHGPLVVEHGLLVTSVMKPRAVVAPLYKDAGRTAQRGATYAAPVVIERREGFDGDVVLQMASHPDRVMQGIFGHDLVVPAGVERIEFPLFLPEWVQTDRTSRVILNTVVRVPDPRGSLRYLVNKMDTRITLNVEGALLKLAAPVTDFEVKAGQSLQIPLTLSRSPKLAGDVRLELRTDGNGSPLEASPITVPAGQEHVEYSIRCRQPLGQAELPITIRATVWPAPHLPVISETQVVLMPSL